MGNCVYYVPPNLLQAPATQSCELSAYTHALYDARELAIERLQDEAEALGATGVVDVTVSEQSHAWRQNYVEHRQRRAPDRRDDRAVRHRHRGRADAGRAAEPPRASLIHVVGDRSSAEATEEGRRMSRPVPALSDLSVTEFLTLSRMGFLPHGLVIGASVFEADTRGTAAKVDCSARSSAASRSCSSRPPARSTR